MSGRKRRIILKDLLGASPVEKKLIEFAARNALRWTCAKSIDHRWHCDIFDETRPIRVLECDLRVADVLVDHRALSMAIGCLS